MSVLLLRFRRLDVSRIASFSPPTEPELFEALESDECYLYRSIAIDRAAEEQGLMRRALDAVAADATIARLDLLLDLPGASAGAPALRLLVLGQAAFAMLGLATTILVSLGRERRAMLLTALAHQSLRVRRKAASAPAGGEG